MKKYGEVIDDHQLDFAKELEKEGRVGAIYDVNMLEDALKRANVESPKVANDKRLTSALKNYVAQFARK